MKYMGSKRWMLGNGLGHLLDSTAPQSGRFLDLFSGSAAVAAFVATRHNVCVYSADLQTYSKVLSAAILERTEPLAVDPTWSEWKESAIVMRQSIRRIPDTSKLTQQTVHDARAWCSRRRKWIVTRAYGGHYFSPEQSTWLDALRMTLPAEPAYHTVALAAVIEAAAYCAAAPGHTAQPFQPTRTAKRWLKEMWKRDPLIRSEAVFKSLCSRHAMVQGSAVVEDAIDAAKKVRAGDLVFIDPPYSGVHYSRFYHVLETVATGYCDRITGVGRYPLSTVRPKSDFSLVSKSENALDNLLREVAARGANAIVTFPDHECSNGLSGRAVTKLASKYFRVDRKVVSSRLSSLGGTSGASAVGSERAARLNAKELILYLRSRSKSSGKALSGKA
jgi:adenine-specific DNA-methyltransferase